MSTESIAPPDDDVQDATVIEETIGTDLTVAQAGTSILMPLGAPEQVKEAMVAYQQTLDAILDPTDWQGAPGSKGSFVKKSGWRKIAKAFGLSVTIIRDRIVRDQDGQLVRAEVWVRATAPNGQVFDGDGYCAADEPRFQKAGGRQKIENDLPATATTRAMNRAISSLVGFGEVSAEETTGGGTEPAAWAQPIDQAGDQGKAFRGALGQLVGPEKAVDLYRDLIIACDGLPAIVADFVLSVYEHRA